MSVVMAGRDRQPHRRHLIDRGCSLDRQRSGADDREAHTPWDRGGTAESAAARTRV